MKQTQLTILFFLAAATAFSQALQLQNLRCEYRTNPLGIDAAKPRLSWQIIADKRNVMQTAYRILVSDDSLQLVKNTGNSWDSKPVKSNASILVPYGGKPLLATKNISGK